MVTGPVPAAIRAFDAVFLPWMRSRFASVLCGGLPHEPTRDRPMMLVANHVSWWDGFLLRELQRELRPGAPLHVVMLESELKKRRFFSLLGAVGVDPAIPTSIAHAVRTLRERLLRRPDSIVMFFPQGRIWPSHRRPLGFREGIELFTRHLPESWVLPVGIHLEPLANAAPTAFLRAGEPRLASAPEAGAAALESEVERLLDSVLHFVAEHGEDAAEAWPKAQWSRMPAAGAEAR